MKFLPWLLVFFALYAQWGYSDDLLPHLEEVSTDYAMYKHDSREPVLYPVSPKERMEVNINMSFLKYGFTNNTIHSLTDDSQFRVVGWKYQIGAHLGVWADVYGEHFSQHILDKDGGHPYPCENLLGVKIYLYRRGQ